MKVKALSHVQLIVTPWAAAYQAPPSMGFSRQEYWNGLPLPSPHLLARKILLDVHEHTHTPLHMLTSYTCDLCSHKRSLVQKVLMLVLIL